MPPCGDRHSARPGCGLQSLPNAVGGGSYRLRVTGSAADIALWAESGAMALTGPADGAPSAAPAVVASAMEAAAADLAVATGRWGTAVQVDGPALLGERAALAGMSRQGSVSVGGAAQFVRTRTGWIVLNLPRPEDVASLPALVGATVDPDDWPAISARLEVLPGFVVVETAALLGIAAAVPGSVDRTAHPAGETHRGARRQVTGRPLVVDMSSLWAGPLLTSLLAEAGARVVKVEGRGRPDGARRGSAAFFDLLNHDKECLALDFSDADDMAVLQRLIAAADLVVEGSRPRVMEGLGIDPVVVADGGTSWLSITGHGRAGFAGQRVGFGDDTAVAGGLFIDGDPPMFVGDAIADPIAGLVGATVTADLLAADRAAVVDLPLARCAAWMSSRPVDAAVTRRDDEWYVDTGAGDVRVAPPRARPAAPVAPGPGAHDDRLRAEFGPAAEERPAGSNG